MWDLRICELLLSYLRSAPSNLSICKISRKKTKMPKFGTKKASFGYFWGGFWKQYCHIWNQHPRIFLIAKFHGKTKCLNLGSKMPYLSIFGLEFKKNYCHVWNQHLQICQKWVFNSHSEFWYKGSTFSKERSRVRFFWRSRFGSGSAL